MSNPSSAARSGGSARLLRRPVEVIVVSSVMFTFITYWRTAAVVLCDLASTAYYIGGIVEGAIGPAAPWFILAVMIFSYAVRSIYIESCSLFVRGGVYRVVKAALGGSLAKLSVSALMFDYILTGPISGMSAGQYIMGLMLDLLAAVSPHLTLAHDTAQDVRRWGSMAIASLITLYFFRQNLLGIHESSGKALKIMVATTIMAVVVLSWCGATLLLQGPVNSIPFAPDLRPKVEHVSVIGTNRVTGDQQEMWQRDPVTGKLVAEMVSDGQGGISPKPKINEITHRQEDPLGALSWIAPGLAVKIREPGHWWHVIGLIGILVAFGHSILAMSGEETLAQVYREVQSPKLRNFKKAAFIVFVYSLVLTSAVAFLAVLLIPDEVRLKVYADNLIGGLAMHVIGPPLLRLLLNGFVVVVGFLILAGAVNTAMIGSNGVLNRVAEDGVLPEWVLKPHKRYGTTYRILYLIVALQLITILLSGGSMYLLGEAYAFGVVWSFVFKALAMIVLRFKDRSPREFKVPMNLRIRGVEVPIGLMLVFLLLVVTAILNFLTKEVASVAGMICAAGFFTTFVLSEHYYEKKRGLRAHEHLEQFNRRVTDEIDPAVLGLSKPYRKLVSIRSSQNLYMLEKTLLETDPETTDVVVMTAKTVLPGDNTVNQDDFDHYDQQLMTAVVSRAEAVGKEVKPLILPSNNPLFAIVNTAKLLNVQELTLGTSNKYTADEQLEQIALYWMNVGEGSMTPLTVRLLSAQRDVTLDLAGGNRIPKITERHARSIDELRAAGVGVRRALFVHPGTAEGSDLFEAVLTMLDTNVVLGVVRVGNRTRNDNATDWLERDVERSLQWNRRIQMETLIDGKLEDSLIQLAQNEDYDVLIVGQSSASSGGTMAVDLNYLIRQAPCRVCVISPTAIPADAEGGSPGNASEQQVARANTILPGGR